MVKATLRGVQHGQRNAMRRPAWALPSRARAKLGLVMRGHGWAKRSYGIDRCCAAPAQSGEVMQRYGSAPSSAAKAVLYTAGLSTAQAVICTGELGIARAKTGEALAQSRVARARSSTVLLRAKWGNTTLRHGYVESSDGKVRCCFELRRVGTAEPGKGKVGCRFELRSAGTARQCDGKVGSSTAWAGRRDAQLWNRAVNHGVGNDLQSGGHGGVWSRNAGAMHSIARAQYTTAEEERGSE